LFKALAFDKTANGFHYLERFDVLPQYNLTLTFGADGLSIVFVLLTVFIFPAMLLACYSVQQERKSFIAYMLGMEILLLLTFTTLDLFYFYVFFESLLIPMFILIGVWGARERKIKAANYFFLYTLFGSLFMLFGVLYLYFLTGSTNYFVLQNCTLELEQQCII